MTEDETILFNELVSKGKAIQSKIDIYQPGLDMRPFWDNIGHQSRKYKREQVRSLLVESSMLLRQAKKLLGKDNEGISWPK